MEYKLKFADVVFHILSEREIELNPELQPFLAAETEPADITVQVSWDWEHAKLPDSDRAGEDLLSYYYTTLYNIIAIVPDSLHEMSFGELSYNVVTWFSYSAFWIAAVNYVRRLERQAAIDIIELSVFYSSYEYCISEVFPVRHRLLRFPCL